MRGLSSLRHLTQHRRNPSVSRTYNTSATKSNEYDAIVIGGGHNGLVSASYLGKAGKKVLVLERRHVVGGAAITEEMVPGFHFSRASYLCSLFRPQIISDLNLKKHGMHLLARNPSSFTPTPDDKYLLMGPDAQLNHDQIAKFSKKDAEAFPKYEAMLDRMSKFLDLLIDDIPVDLADENKSTFLERLKNEIPSAMKLTRGLVDLGRTLPDMYELMTAPASKILYRWFESEPLISTLATDAVIGAMMSPSTPGSGYVLMHHCMGEAGGQRGSWYYVRGGMGAVSQAIASFATKEAGVTIKTNAEVKQVIVKGDKAVGVVLADGTEYYAKAVLSNCDPDTTYFKLLSDNVASLPDRVVRDLKSIDYTSATFKINLAVDRIPNFKAKPNERDNESGPQHRGTIHLTHCMQEIEDGYQYALVNKKPCPRPIIEMTIPSAVDNTIAPPGKHVVQLFVQYAPYQLAEGLSWNDAGRRQEFAKSCYKVIEEYAPGFTSSIVGEDLLSPLDLEQVFGLKGGNIFHGSVGLDQLYWKRPIGGYSKYRTPIRGMYMCGSGAHPGGGVMGAAGKNASRVVLEDLSNSKQ